MDNDKKLLNEDELNKVSGGSVNEDAPSEFKCSYGTFTGFLSKYAEKHIGKKLYLVKHDGSEYYYGELRDSFEADDYIGTERTQHMFASERNGAFFYGIVGLSGDDYFLYTTKA